MVVGDPEDPSSPGFRPAPAPLLVTFLSLTQVSQRPSTIVCALGERQTSRILSSTPPSQPPPCVPSLGAHMVPTPSLGPVPVSPRCEHSGLSIGQGVVGERG